MAINYGSSGSDKGTAISQTIGAMILGSVTFLIVAAAMLAVDILSAIFIGSEHWTTIIASVMAGIIIWAMVARYLCDRWIGDYSRHAVAIFFVILTFAELIHMSGPAPNPRHLNINPARRTEAFVCVILFGIASPIAFEVRRPARTRK